MNHYAVESKNSNGKWQLQALAAMTPAQMMETLTQTAVIGAWESCRVREGRHTVIQWG